MKEEDEGRKGRIWMRAREGRREEEKREEEEEARWKLDEETQGEYAPPRVNGCCCELRCCGWMLSGR